MRRQRATSCSCAAASSGRSSAGLWTFMPLGWRVHQKVVQIIREEMNAIGGQEMLCPVLTPAELWETHRADRNPRGDQADGRSRSAVRPAAVARGDDDVPRAGDPLVQRAAAGLVPLLDEGAGRAAAAGRPSPRARVHHEGLVLVRPRRGRARRELRPASGGVQAHVRALRGRRVRRRGGVRDHGRYGVARLPCADELGRERAHALRERRLLRRHRGRPRRPSSAGVPGTSRCAGGDRDAGRGDDRGPCRPPRASTPRRPPRRCRSSSATGWCSRSFAETTA